MPHLCEQSVLQTVPGRQGGRLTCHSRGRLPLPAGRAELPVLGLGHEASCASKLCENVLTAFPAADGYVVTGTGSVQLPVGGKEGDVSASLCSPQGHIHISFCDPGSENLERIVRSEQPRWEWMAEGPLAEGVS